MRCMRKVPGASCSLAHLRVHRRFRGHLVCRAAAGPAGVRSGEGGVAGKPGPCKVEVVKAIAYSRDTRDGPRGWLGWCVGGWRRPGWGTALAFFAAACGAAAFGVAMAVREFPGEFDWMYTVLSHLASTRRNPEGGRWLAGAFLVAVVLLWPVVTRIGECGAEGEGRRGHRTATLTLRVGLLGGGLLGIEGVTGLRFSDYLHKAHEATALLTFFAFYGGVLGHLALRARASRGFRLPAALIILPVVGVGFAQLGLYIDQRDLGWVTTDWRALGVPFWMSLAFWQWTAAGCLATGLGVLVYTAKGLTSEAWRGRRT